MARLRLSLLGPFQLTLEEPRTEPVAAHLESHKVRGLLAYLAVEHRHPHPREALAELLWPGDPPAAANGNFRRSLANLRIVLGDRTAGAPCLFVTRDTIQFNCGAGVGVDVLDFQSLLETSRTHSQWPSNIERAVTLYGGPFLEGFYLNDCPDFEQWMLEVRRKLEHLAVDGLVMIAEYAAAEGDMERSLRLGQRCIDVDPCNERAHRCLMRVLAAEDRRNEALSHYDAYCRFLLDDVGAKPEASTVALMEQIRGSVFVRIARKPPHREVYGRDSELRTLHGCAREVHLGDGAIALVCGEAGSGKTWLVEEFVRRLRAADARWLIAMGACTALLGFCDPYTPFVACLRSLVETAEDVDLENALGAEAPDWVRLLHAAPRPFARQTSYRLLPRPADQSPLRGASSSFPASGRVTGAGSLVEQLACLLRRLARKRPLLCFVDNLQWSSPITHAIFFHLAETLTHEPILLLTAYRDSNHITEHNNVVHELCFHRSATLVNLDHADRRAFVDALIDAEPNRLGDDFRIWLLEQTEGHALLTVDLLATLRKSGRLACAVDGVWESVGGFGAPLPELTARSSAWLSAQLDDLSAFDRKVLEIASLEGDEFSTDEIATALGTSLAEVSDRISGALCAQGLLCPSRFHAVSETPSAYYRFCHRLLRTFLRSRLGSA